MALNVDNLIPNCERTAEERQNIARAGGIASGKARRRKSSMRESLEILLNLPLKGGKQTDVDAIKNYADLKGKNITVEQAMIIAQIQKALKGDTSALAFLRDTSGQKPIDAVNMAMTGGVPVQIVDDMDGDDGD